MTAVLTTPGAESTSALAALRHAYTHRLDAARQAQARGQSVVGLVGQTIPAELVLASGRFPMLITAERDRPTPTAEQYMEEVTTPETRSLFDLAVTGSFEFLDLLVLSRPYAHLYYYLKEVYRLGRGPRIPPLHSYDLMQGHRAALRAYNWQQTRHLVERLERLAGAPILDAVLWPVIEQTNARRALQRQLLELRWAGAVSGVDAMQVLGASAFLEPAAYSQLLAAYLESVRPSTGSGRTDSSVSSLQARPRLLTVSSEPLTYTDLHAALENVGALVAAEDDWWGARMPGADVPLAGSALEAIFQKVWLDTASAGAYPAEAREGWLRQQAQRPEVDGIVFYVPPSDHQFGWDYPRLRDWVAEIGKPQLLLRADVTQPVGRATVEEQARAFVAQLPGRSVAA